MTTKKDTIKQESVATTKKAPVIKENFIRAVGRRKTSVARVRLFRDGKGEITINDKDWKVYFPVADQQATVFSPLKLTNQGENLNFSIKVLGGGTVSQSGAVRHGITRALVALDEAFKPSLKKAGFTTRDPRIKERKKPGLKRARRAPQWKKR